MKPQAQILLSLVVAFVAALLLAGPIALAAGDPDTDPPLVPLPPPPAPPLREPKLDVKAKHGIMLDCTVVVR